MLQLKWTKLTPLSESGVSGINKVAGVYRLSYYDSNEKAYYVYYVGQAADLNARLNQHRAGNEQNSCCARYLKSYNCFFRAAAISGQADRDGAEVALYNKYTPSCVEKTPDVKPIQINFE